MERCPYCFKPLPESGVCDCRYEESKNARIEEALHPGAIVGACYQIGAVLGKGGFGITYKAFDLNMQKVVAIKEFYPDGLVTRGKLYGNITGSKISKSEVLTMSESSGEVYRKSLDLFYREAVALGKLDKLPNVVHAHHVFRENGTAYIVMEFVNGQSLKAMVEERGKIPERELLGLLDPVLTALEKVHEENILHRDIAPDNVMIENGNPVLLDFGAARVEDGHHSSLVIGKKGYSSPEQIASGAVDRRSDIYSMGAAYYKALSGITPQDSTLRMMNDHVTPLKHLGLGISESVSDAVMKAMAIKPEERFADAAAFQQALKEKSTTEVNPPSGGKGGGNGSGSGTTGEKPSKKTAIIAAAVLAVLAGVLFLFRKQPLIPVPVSDQEMTMTAIAAYKETSTAAAIQTETQRVIDGELTKIAGDLATGTAIAHETETKQAEPTPEPTNTPEPSSTPKPTATKTRVPTNTPRPTSTPRPTATKTRVPTKTPRPTSTPRPTATKTRVPTNTPRPTSTPRPTATKTRVPTNTPRPTSTPRPTATKTRVPTNTPRPTSTPKLTATLDPESLYQIGEDAYQKEDYSKALEYLIPAAESGNSYAQFLLGYMYDTGEGVTQSYEKAVEWYQKAADQGDAGAQCNLGVMYATGRGVLQSDEKAVEWYQKAADQGLARAQFNLGYKYDYGEGVTQSYEKAVEWYQKAADQGDARAQFNLGYMYEYGEGVTQSYEKAVEWYQKAADQGHAVAQLNLGVMYENGEGVTKSISKAKEWYQKAADQGDEDAIAALERLK